MTDKVTIFDFSIGYLNIEGIHDSHFGCKIPYIEKKMINDIEILSETWGTCKHELNVDYKCFDLKSQKRNTKKGRASGGLKLYYKSHLHKYIKEIKQTNNYIWVEICKSLFLDLKENLRICALYIPPENSEYNRKDIFDELGQDIIDLTNSDSPYLLIGDLNSRTGTIDENNEHDDDPLTHFTTSKKIRTKRENCDTTTNSQGKKLINMCKSFDLQILNGRYSGDCWGNFTHHNKNKGSSTVDLGISSDALSSSIKNFHVLSQLEITDHCKIVTQVKNYLKEGETLDTKPHYVYVYVYVYGL